MNKNLMQLQNLLRDNGIIISFSGWFSQGIIEELGEAIRQHMKAEKRTKNSIFNVFAIFIEQSQNIRNYTTSKEGTFSYDKIANSGIITIGKMETEYYIYSGNLIETVDGEKLKEKLELVRKLNKDELKKLYKDEIKKEIPESTSGAGVGIIDMARKSSKTIEYSLEKLDDKFSFFELKVIV